MALMLTSGQRETLLASILYRVSQFPRGALHAKLKKMDAAYHLAKVSVPEDMDPTDPANKQLYSRFEELDNALVREVAETYSTKFITAFLSKSQIFAMTSGPDNMADAEAFNTILEDQQKETKWRVNLAKFLLDVAKYNLALADVHWTDVINNQVTFNPHAAPGAKVATKPSLWSGNAITRWDPYNSFFDVSQDLENLSTKGEFAGTCWALTQVALKDQIDILRADKDRVVYLTNSADPNFDLFNLSQNAGSQGVNGVATTHITHVSPDVITRGAEEGKIETDWARTFGMSVREQQTNKQYTLAKFYLRVVPSSYGVGRRSIFDSPIELWEVYILDSQWVLSTKKLTNVHQLLPVVLAQTDADSLKVNTTGPAQVAVPYQKTAKQLMDRILASADRAIGDRAIFNGTYLDKNAVNSHIPDAKIEMKKNLPAGNSIDSIYRSIEFRGDGIFRLYGDRDLVENAGRTAAGLNKAQMGQFTPGNRTLQEYNNIQSNAEDKTFVRLLLLEASAWSQMKYMIKLNIIQYQKEAKLYSSESKTEIQITQDQLYQARVDFELADALLPTQFMLSPNVQQQLLQLITQLPQLFQEYDLVKLVEFILSQSNGLQLQKFKVARPGAAAPTGAPDASTT